jgi:NADPH:quinone reductase-like Zn-dependent oxidoreductase
MSLSLRPRKRSRTNPDDEPAVPPPVPTTQTVLLLHAPKEEYTVTSDHPVPGNINANEVLVRTKAIGLNPIDWKSAYVHNFSLHTNRRLTQDSRDFNFAIPELPYIAGRELSGDVVQVGTGSRWAVGDKVVAISTDYRDLRKGAYQEYVVSLDHTTVRLPSSISYEEGSTLGVAFVAAALALGVSMGVDFSHVLDGPDLFKLVRDVDVETIPQDVRDESLNGIKELERPRPGDWLAIWGGKSHGDHPLSINVSSRRS